MILNKQINAKANFLIMLIFCFAFINPLFSSDLICVDGIVKDSQSGLPIRNVNITVKNTSNGSTTDIEGRFELRVSAKLPLVLLVSHVCYLEKEVKLDDYNTAKEIHISLQPRIMRLKEAIATGSLYEKQLGELTRSASVISHRDIEDNMQSNMIDVLATNPEFTQIWEYHSPILLRGMNSKRVVVMKDGARRIGSFPGGYFAQDLNVYEGNKVEIIKGPGSVISGSGAISGVINTTSNPPFGERKINMKILSGFGSNNKEFLEVAKVCLKRKRYGMSISGKFRTTDDYAYSHGEKAENTNATDRDLSASLGYMLSSNQSLTLRTDYHSSDWGKPRGFNGPNNYFSKIRNEEERFHASLNYGFTPEDDVQAVKLDVYFDSGTRDYYKYAYNLITDKLSSLNLVHYRDDYTGGRCYSVFKLSENNKLTTGVDWYYFQLDNPVDVIDFYNGVSGTIAGYDNAGQYDLGVFMNEDLKMLSNLRLVAGVRYDRAKVFEGSHPNRDEREESRDAVSGNTGLVYSLSDMSHLSFNIGRAFRMPTSEELFTEVISCKGIKIGNPNLKPEYSWNYDLGYRGNMENDKFTYDVSLFYNNLDDYITETLDETHEDIDFTYDNTDAKIMGGEASFSYRLDRVFKPANSLFLAVGTSYVYGVDLSSENDNEPLFGVPPLRVLTDMKYLCRLSNRWISSWQVKFEVEYAAEQNRIASVSEGFAGGPWGYIPSDSHTVLNAGLGLNSNSLPGQPKIRIVVKNFLDSDYKPFGSYIPAMGRNIKATVSWNFNKAG